MRKTPRADATDDADDPAAPTEILDALRASVTTFEELCEHFLPTLAARIWATCCWPEKMADGWSIGDFRFMVVAVSPERNTQLYVQFWSEPGERVLNEVSSGEWSPGSVKYVQRKQRELLGGLAFRKGGEAKNFGKELTVTKVAHAEAAAREALWIFFEAFGYRGQWPLELRLERGSRARHDVVHDSLTPDDLVKLLTGHGYRAEEPESSDGSLILARRGRRRFTARLDWRVPRNNLYAAMILDGLVPASAFVSDEGLVALTLQLPGVAVQRFEADGLRLSMAVRLEGGVTDQWIVHAVSYFLNAVRQCERLLRAASEKSPRARECTREERVH